MQERFARVTAAKTGRILPRAERMEPRNPTLASKKAKTET